MASVVLSLKGIGELARYKACAKRHTEVEGGGDGGTTFRHVKRQQRRWETELNINRHGRVKTIQDVPVTCGSSSQKSLLENLYQ